MEYRNRVLLPGRPRRADPLPVPAAIVALALMLATAAGAQKVGDKPGMVDRGPAGAQITVPAELIDLDRREESMTVRGGTATRIDGRSAGISPKELGGEVEFITWDDWREMKDVPKTGLFILGARYIPSTLPMTLKEQGLRFDDDGALVDIEGKPQVLVVRPEMYAFSREKEASTAPASGPDKSVAQSIAEYMLGGLVGEAHAANPHPWACYSWNFYWRYDGGFCRSYRSGTDAWAWGAGADGPCDWPRPATRIQNIQTYTAMGSRLNRSFCNNCSEGHSRRKWDIGCFWPAHGGTGGWSYIDLVDGGLRATRFWSWSD